MSINITFHDQQLVVVRILDNDLTSVNIYDNDRPYGSHVTMFFNNPTEVADWAFDLANKAHLAAKEHIANQYDTDTETVDV